MKNFFFTVLFVGFSSIFSFGQSKNVTIVRSSKGMYIEAEGGLGSDNAIRISLTAANQLTQGMKKAKEWSIINKKIS